jgi:hypothetical protein
MQLRLTSVASLRDTNLPKSARVLAPVKSFFSGFCPQIISLQDFARIDQSSRKNNSSKSRDLGAKSDFIF